MKGIVRFAFVDLAKPVEKRSENYADKILKFHLKLLINLWPLALH